MKTLSKLVIPLLAALSAAPAAHAQSPAELLEKGIYTEETAGDLEAAIRIYRQVLETSDAQRGQAAQAQLRLGICLMRTGRKAEACDQFEKLIKAYPQNAELVASAKKHLAACATRVELTPAPWVDGEIERLALKLESGLTIGALSTHIKSTLVDGRPAWNLEVRRFVPVSGNNQGISRSTVERDSLAPIRSMVRHTMLGNCDGVWSDGQVEVTCPGSEGPTTKTREVAPGTFENEEAFFVMRSLPLAIGYHAKLNVLPLWTCTELAFDVSVPRTEEVVVPAGTFECFRVETTIGQTFWYSTQPARTLVKLAVEGVIGELTEVTQAPTSGPVVFREPKLGFSLTTPAGWDSFVFAPEEREGFVPVALLDPEVRFSSVAEVRASSDPETLASVLAVAREELEGAKKRSAKYVLREDTWLERAIAGHPAVSFAGDYEQGGKKMVQYRAYVLHAGVLAEFIFRMDAADFEKHRATFDAIVESFHVEPKPH